jgi:hypothetical protein
MVITKKLADRASRFCQHRFRPLRTRRLQTAGPGTGSGSTLGRRGGGSALGAVILLSAVAVVTGPRSVADPTNAPSPPLPPSDSSVIRTLPAFTPTPSNWTPKFPFPYDQTRSLVTDADIHAMGEMCQWFNSQYATLIDQIGRLQNNRIGPDGRDFDYGNDDVQEQADVVTGNLDRSVDFLTPRVQALTQTQDHSDDTVFPVYQGEQFFQLHEQLFDVSNGIKAHQPDWFSGPSAKLAERRGSEIYRSHVCD